MKLLWNKLISRRNEHGVRGGNIIVYLKNFQEKFQKQLLKH